MLDLSISKQHFLRQQRLIKPSDYQRVYKSRKWGRNAFFAFNVIRSDAERARIGITVSKKVSRKAVVRNRIKRQIREFYRTHCNDIAGFDVVITARAKSATAKNNEIQNALSDLWADILKYQSKR